MVGAKRRARYNFAACFRRKFRFSGTATGDHVTGAKHPPSYQVLLPHEPCQKQRVVLYTSLQYKH